MHILERLPRGNHQLFSFHFSDLLTIQGGVMTNLIAIGLDKYKKDYVKVHPEVDEKGEFAELQVLQEAFDSDQCLDQLEKNKRPAMPLSYDTHEIQ